MYNLLSSETPASLRSFLQDVIPSLAEDWWARYVVNALTFQQQRRVEESRIESLAGLDLAALIRVLDQNWYEISNKVSLPREARNYVKEMQSIRNRWAHRSGEALPPDDMFRDLDTLQRFLEAIQADKDLIGKVRDKKQACHNAAPTANHREETPQKPLVPETEFTVGEIIVLRADPSVTGAVIQVLAGKPENRYLVFANGNTFTYYASQLARKESPAATREIIPLDQFHAHLTALQLQHPGTSNLYSLHAARINFIPYQFKPVLKLIHSDRPRLLIADEVGVGKTIEAGLILRELQARRDINSVLIICPKPLVTERKWQAELKRFDEHFEHLDGEKLRSCISETDLDGVWPDKYAKCILPFSLFSVEMLHGSDDKRRSKRKGIIALDPLPHFDLVIVDEAHHLRNSSGLLHQGVRFFCENAEAVVFLTATPVQLGSNDLFTLLNLLRPDLIIDQTSYSHMADPNPHINSAIELARLAEAGWHEKAGAALKQAASTPWGRAILQNNPAFQRLYDQLHDRTLSSEERIAFIRETEQFHTFSSLINRTRRRDIGKFTTRKPETVAVEFTPEQAKLHNGLLDVQAKIFQRIHGDQNLMFMMTTIRRQAASCLYGLAPFLEDILTRRTDELQLLEVDEEWDSLDGAKISSIEGEIQKILAMAKNLPPDDPKIEAFLKIAHSKETLPNNKMLLFSSFRHTLRYIHRHLLAAGFRVEIIHGDVPDEDRRHLRNRFSMPRENPDTIDILLSSEVGCEGLDYQFCDCLVNYDLPWNPMRVEQRIGRIDRYGQKSETVAIYNLITPGTVDADIYERCLWRIGVFRDAIGGSEEILGRITQEIRAVAENLSLSDDERGKKLQQIADNDIRLIQEQAELEEKQPELFGLRLPAEHYHQEVQQASSYWLSPWALQNLVRHYLEGTCGNDLEYILGEKELKTLRLNQDARNRLLEDYKRLPRKKSPVYRDWEKWLKGSNQHLQITFDAAMASENRDATFITPVHPLALQAAQFCADSRTTYTAFKVACDDVAPGTYPFAMYIWQKHGVREDVTFQPVCADPALSFRFLELMGQSVMIEPGLGLLPEQAVFDQLDREHHRLWIAARTEHQEYNFQLVQYRKESLQTSHRARLSILQEQLEKATEVKIRIMRQSEIARAEADFMRRMEEVEKAEVQADISAQAVVFGVMVLEG